MDVGHDKQKFPRKIRVAMAGNPNVGKTALLNALTKGNFEVGNFPGTTVEIKKGRGKINNTEVEFVDLPGIYSLSAISIDEKLARDYILNEKPDLILNVVDASNLERNLYLTLQLLELGIPTIVVLNMIDEAESRGMEIDLQELQKELKVPVIATVAIKNKGVEELKRAILDRGKKRSDLKLRPEERFEIAEKISNKVIRKKEAITRISELLDDAFMDEYLGIPIFLSFIWIAFRFTYDVATPLVDAIDLTFSYLASVFSGDSLINLLIADGIINGVGSVVVFLPNISFLFIALALLELSGYMARAVYITDRLMEKVGLSGRSVVPLIMGFGCNVPAVLSTRTIDDTKTRLTTILIIPFISCSARLPIYVLFVSLFFPNIKSEMIMLLYLIGFGFAIFSAFILRKTLLKGEVSFIMEMPPYRIPTLRDVIMLTWNRTKHFLQKAGTVILAMSIVIWFITNFPSGDITESYAAKVGILIQPIFQPMGWGWEETLAILMGFVAKEVVVETFGIVLGDTSRLIEIMTPSQAFGFIIFTLLYMPCMATLAVIKAETESWKWVIFSVLYTSLVAYFTALLAVNVLSLVGW